MIVGLIDFLRNWGESLFSSKKEFIAAQAMPAESSTEYSYESTDSVTFTAPSDGYLTIGASQANGETRIICWGGVESTIADKSGEALAVFSPMRKGQVKYFSVSAYRFVRFYPLVGGGLSSILQAIGGGLCLLSYSFNRFTSSLVRKPCRANQTLTLEVCQRLVRGAKRTPLSQMDTLSCLGFTLRQLKSRTLQNTFELNHQQVFQQVFLFPLVKAIKSISTANTQEQGACSLSSLRPSAQANLAMGGAL